jgi:hypothetical protein
LLTVIKLHSFPPSYWECLCDCGLFVIVKVDNLSNGHTKSCGCLKQHQIWKPIKIDDNTYGIPLKSGDIALIDKEDYILVKMFSWHIKNKNGYVQSARNKINKKRILLHRLILNPQDNKDIDHINGNILDNRKSNLRVCTNKENHWNTDLKKSNKSGYKGVSWDKEKEKWYTSIRLNEKTISLGRYNTAEEASEAYKKASLEHHKEFSVFSR